MGIKLAVTGKGGVGKTTLSSVLARMYAADGYSVLAADVDPDANLGLALGFTAEEIAAITPISEMSELIKERTGASDEGFGRFFKINPRVDDIPDRFAAVHEGVKLLVMGTVDTAGSGCVCPEHVMLKRVLSHLVFQRNDVVIMDMEAGLEHLGRGTAAGMDMFITVVEPGARSVQTYNKVKELALGLGVKRVAVAANKIRTAEDEAFIKANIPEEDLLGFIHWSPEVAEADRTGASPFDLCPQTVAEIAEIRRRIESV